MDEPTIERFAIDPERIKTYPIKLRRNKVVVADFARVCPLGSDFKSFIDSLPKILVGNDFRAAVKATVTAHKNGKPIIFAMGGHVIKCGLSPLIIDLMKRRVITTIATNGGGSIHDFEIALIGATSEDVARTIQDGSFGMAEETGRLMNEAIKDGAKRNLGMGQALGRKLLKIDAPYKEYSILIAGATLDIPVTVHIAIGGDTIHQHPCADGEAIGKTSFIDFHMLTSQIANLGNGGVFLNVGSAVILPEVFLKGLNLSRNLGHHVFDFVTVNLDMIQQYRPTENVVKRPTMDGGKGYSITGHHELMIPLLYRAILEELDEHR